MTLRRLRLRRPRRHDRQVRVGLRRQRHVRDQRAAPRRRPRTPSPTAGTVNVGLRVTDNGGKTATTTVAADRQRAAASSNYGDAVLDTAGLDRLLAHGRGSGTDASPTARARNPATAQRRRHARRARRRRPATPTRPRASTASNDYATANLNLSGTSKLTVEFWLNWTTFANDDRLAMEFTPSYHDNAGGFLIDPNAPQNGGRSPSASARSASRNTAYFTRPDAPASWHHYAFVLRHHGAGGAADHALRRRPGR